MRRTHDTAWRVPGRTPGWRSWSVLVVLVVTGGAWLTWPVWDSTGNPDRGQVVAEAPWLLAVLTAGLVLLGTAVWRDAGRRTTPMSAVTLLVAVTCAVRALLSPASSGVEFVHAWPILAGVALGAPAGFLTGASACLVSTVLFAVPAETLPTQAVVWGLIGASGGLLHAFRPVLAWLLSLPLAVLAGMGSGVALNLMGWAQEPGTSTLHFFPGLPPGEVLHRLWSYTLETSLAYDTTRGITTALVLLVAGLPLIRALRPALPVPLGTSPAPAEVSKHAVDRRADRARLDRLWPAGATTSTTPTVTHHLDPATEETLHGATDHH